MGVEPTPSALPLSNVNDEAMLDIPPKGEVLDASNPVGWEAAGCGAAELVFPRNDGVSAGL